MTQLMDVKKLYYQQVVTLWEEFCHLHKELYDLTCDEYLTLLASDIDKLEGMLPTKEAIIARISSLETERGNLIATINERDLFNGKKITKASDLLIAFAEIDTNTAIPALKNLNGLLIDIIQKIQEQNKKNQVFLNKAMLSLREIKQGFAGKKSYTTYGADGMTRTMGR
jgi:flagellar biosynthesis/type III secretory pathway chaperone